MDFNGDGKVYSMKLYRAAEGNFVEEAGLFYSVAAPGWDELICSEDLFARVRAAIKDGAATSFNVESAMAPIVGQEVWAAGVTYYRSRNARIEESKDAGGGDFYDRVYAAERPEIFFKSVGYRVVGPGGAVRIRSDASWSVPEPELTLLVNPRGAIVGYTIGNDMSSRDIEGENPLYLPQAKMYDGACALGPCVLLSEEEPSKATSIAIEILRAGKTVFEGATMLAELKRELKELVKYLYLETAFPQGAFLMTGTGVVPEDDFTLAHGDVIRISIEGIGVLENYVS
jgi:2-dehydro-3-deoxy-D-arabinonate dehydratase